MSQPWIALAVAVVVAAGLTPAAAAGARRTGVVDRPGPLKPQDRAVPYFGGLAVAAAVAVPTLACGAGLRLVAPTVALLVGLADDCSDLPPTLRLALEALVGILVAGDDHLLHQPVLAVAAAAMTVAVVNGVNVIDGLDGLLGGVGAVGALAFALTLSGSPRFLSAATAGALAGFLVYNRPPASIYLGDAGSYFVGTVLAELWASSWLHGSSSVALGDLLLVAYPVGELVCSVIRRWRARTPVMKGDRDHTYDRLVARGLKAGTTSIVCVTVEILLGIGAVVSSRIGADPAALLVGAIVTVLVAGALVTGLLSPARS